MCAERDLSRRRAESAYVAYFEQVWLKSHPPHLWAYYARANTKIGNEAIPTGDQALESWHSRLHKRVEENTLQGDRLDQVVKLLWEEACYQELVIKKQHLFDERRKMMEDRRKQYSKFVSLKDYIGKHGSKSR